MAKLTAKQRKAASVDLTLAYLNNYYAEWRYAKVLTLEKLIKNRYEFYSDLKEQIRNVRDENGDPTIAQEIHHGLYFDAIAQCVQYIEDLFALLKAAKQPEFFIRNIITYKGGEVTAFLKSFKADAKQTASAFHLPNDLKFSDVDNQASYTEGLEKLMGYMNDMIQFYKNYEFFYNQYKHGLSVAMRPFGNIFTEEQVKKDKTGEMPPYLAVYDNMNLQAGFKKGTAKIEHGIMMPGFTENVAPFISELSNENNYLRFVFPPDYPDFDIDILVRMAKKTSYCIQLFIYNYGWKINPDGLTFKFHLPSDYLTKNVIACSYTSD